MGPPVAGLNSLVNAPENSVTRFVRVSPARQENEVDKMVRWNMIHPDHCCERTQYLASWRTP